MAGTSADMEIAQKTWEIENEVETLPASDQIFRYDAQEQQSFLAARKLNCSMRHFHVGLQSKFRLLSLFSQVHGKKIRITSKIFKFRP